MAVAVKAAQECALYPPRPPSGMIMAHFVRETRASAASYRILP